MKIKHYQAPDMRQALRQVRDAQGPDAVILSSRKIAGGVEVVAAVDYDDDGSADSAASQLEQSRAQRTAGGRLHEPETQRSRQLRARAVELERREKCRGGSVAERVVAPAHSDVSASRQCEAAPAFDTTLDVDEPGANVNEELRTLRRMLETQLATLAWNDLSRRAPVQTELLKQLTTLGLAHDLCAELVAQLPARLELSEAHRVSLALIARRIAVAEERWVDAGRHGRHDRPDRRRQDHADRQAGSALGAATRSEGSGADFVRFHAHRRAGTDSYTRSPAGRADLCGRGRRGAAGIAGSAERSPLRPDRHRRHESARRRH